MSLLEDTKQIQSDFALFCRTGGSVNLPGSNSERLRHYRKLIFNIVLENLESAFPIAHSYIETETWKRMVEHFFSEHKCQSYQVWQLAGEFCEFSIQNSFKEHYQLPYLNDLLRFEWEEMLVYNMEDLPIEDYIEEGNLLFDKLVFNPEHKILPLNYPVHLYNPSEAVKHSGQYFVLLYRGQKTGNVEFMDISVWFALLIEQLYEKTMSLKELLEQASVIFGQTNPEYLKTSTFQFFEEMKTRHFFLGFKKKQSENENALS